MDESNKDNEAKEVKKPGVLMGCGHEASFEHSLVEGIGLYLMHAQALGGDPMEPAMAFVRKVFERYCVRMPTWEEIQAIELALFLNKDKEVVQ